MKPRISKKNWRNRKLIRLLLERFEPPALENFEFDNGKVYHNSWTFPNFQPVKNRVLLVLKSEIFKSYTRMHTESYHLLPWLEKSNWKLWDNLSLNCEIGNKQKELLSPSDVRLTTQRKHTKDSSIEPFASAKKLLIDSFTLGLKHILLKKYEL